MFKKFLTLRTLRRSLMELSRSNDLKFDHVSAQLEKTRNELLFLSGCDKLQRELANLQAQIQVSRAIRDGLMASIDKILVDKDENDENHD